MVGEIGTHLGPDAMNSPRLFSAFGGDDALGMKLLADEGMVALGIEFGVGQHAADGCVGMGLSDQGGKVGTIVPRSLPGRLCQDELLLHVDDGQPFQPMSPGQWLLGVVVHAADKERADCALGESGGIDGDGGSPAPSLQDAAHHFLQSVVQVSFVEASQEAIERGVIRDRSQSERSPQLPVLGKTDFSFAKGPVLVAHEAQDGQQLRLRELVFAKAGAVARHRGLGYIPSQMREAHQTDFGHGFAAVSPELPAA